MAAGGARRGRAARPMPSSAAPRAGAIGPRHRDAGGGRNNCGVTLSWSEAIPLPPRAVVVLGSGLSEIAARLLGDEAIPYSALEGMPDETVPGHEGALYRGTVAGKPVVALAGRTHLYEGRGSAAVTRPIEAAIARGAQIVVLTNAAGAISAELEVGAPCLISDHLNLTGSNPLVGRGSRAEAFLDLTDLYDPELRALARSLAPDLKEGVYAGVLGPTYETPAEIRMLATLGADLVGMSTVHEAIVARYLGARVLAISLVTNRAAGLTEQVLTHDEVTAAGRLGAPRLEALLRRLLEEI